MNCSNQNIFSVIKDLESNSILGDIIEMLKKIMEKPPYSEYVYRNVNIIGFNLKNNKNNVLLICREEDISFKIIEKNSNIEPELWVEMDANELKELWKNNKKLTNFRIYTTNKGQVLHPAVERIIQRIFIPPIDNKYPLTDIIELVYGGFTGFQEPRVAWRSKE